MKSSETSEIELRTRNNGASSANDDIKLEEPSKHTTAIKLKSYLIALRVWSLSASIIPTILGKFQRSVVLLARWHKLNQS